MSAWGLDNKVIVVQPIKSGLADVINRQDGLYHLYLRGGEPSAPQVQSRLVSSISRAIDPYRDFEAFLACAEQPELRFIVSNTTEAGISCRTEDRLEDCPGSFLPRQADAIAVEAVSMLLANKRARGSLFFPAS